MLHLSQKRTTTLRVSFLFFVAVFVAHLKKQDIKTYSKLTKISHFNIEKRLCAGKQNTALDFVVTVSSSMKRRI